MVYVYQSQYGFEVEIMTSHLRNEKLRDALEAVTGERYPRINYKSRPEAEAVCGKVNEAYRSI